MSAHAGHHEHGRDNDHGHDHGHDQPHAEVSPSSRPGYYDIMETAVRELLIERRLFGADEIRRQIEELGISFYDDTGLIVLENTDTVHNLIVCTLCSCYPRPVLGLPPDWYKLRPYRARAVSEPRAVLAEFGTVIAEDVEVRVSDSTAMVRYLVLPMRPDGTEGYSEEQLAALVTRDTMIGVAPVRIEPGRGIQ